MPTSSTTRTALLGLVGLALILAFVTVTVGAYRHLFSRAVMVTVDAPRAGLLLDPGADVRLRGVRVGEVRSVHVAGTGARITVALDRGERSLIPSDVSAQIVPSTAVGGKVVSLVAPAHASSTAIEAGQHVPTSAVAPEVDDLFAGTQKLLEAVPVDKLDVVLTTVARTLDGRGQQLGTFLTTLDTYLKGLNADSGSLEADLQTAPAVLKTYADVTPAVLDLLQHSTVTGTTVVSRADDIDKLLTDFTSVTEQGTQLATAVKTPLTHTLADFGPVTRLLAQYSPEFPCTLEGWSSMATNNHSLGVNYPGAQVVMTLLPGQSGYTEKDLPQYVDNRGPECYSLPDVTDPKPPRRNFDDGDHAYDNKTDTVTLGDPILQFFGSSATQSGSSK